jgi:hypothetical protein
MNSLLSAARGALVVLVTAAALGGLGADLTHTAYLASQTAQTVVLGRG